MAGSVNWARYGYSGWNVPGQGSVTLQLFSFPESASFMASQAILRGKVSGFQLVPAQLGC